jgi:predicted site-specific integrase-resolvase
MKSVSTAQVAAEVGIDRVTLERWLRDGKVKLPTTIVVGARRFRLWTAADVERVRQVKAKIYCKGRGRKPRKRGKRDGRVAGSSSKG